MSSRVQRCASVTLVVLLLASPSQAQIPDPVETGLLQRIAAALQAIETFRMKVQDQIQIKIYNRLRSYAFPSPLFNPIRITIASVVDIRRELQRLSCNWPMTPRTLGLRDTLLRRTTFCRSGFHDVWGTHERFWDGPDPGDERLRGHHDGEHDLGAYGKDFDQLGAGPLRPLRRPRHLAQLAG